MFRDIQALAQQMCKEWEIVEKIVVAWVNREIKLDPANALTQILHEKPAELTVFVRDGRSSGKRLLSNMLERLKQDPITCTCLFIHVAND